MDASRYPRESGLSLVIPAYNEEAVIERAVAEANDALSDAFPRYEILVVDDGSIDGTRQKLAQMLVEYPMLRILRHDLNQGYGAALQTGFQAAAYDCVAFTDADCQFDLNELAKLAAHTDKAPIVVGARLDRKDGLRRRILSRGYNLIARTVLGTRIRDVDCALKVFRHEVLESLMPESRGFFVNTEMMAHAAKAGYAIAEVAVTHRPRAGGESKVSFFEVPKILNVLVRFWWRERVLGFAGRIPAAPTRRSTPKAAGMHIQTARISLGSRMRSKPMEVVAERLASRKAG